MGIVLNTEHSAEDCKFAFEELRLKFFTDIEMRRKEIDHLKKIFLNSQFYNMAWDIYNGDNDFVNNLTGLDGKKGRTGLIDFLRTDCIFL